MYALLGWVLRMYAYLGALYLLLFRRLPLQDRAAELRGNLSKVWQICPNCKARPSLYQPLHWNFRHDKFEDKCFGFGKTGNSKISQNIITKDNVSISIDAAVYFRVVNPRYAYYRVQNFNTAISEVTYAILKNTCGQFILQDLLEKRQEIADDIEKQVDQYVVEWGVDVNSFLCRSKKFSLRISN